MPRYRIGAVVLDTDTAEVLGPEGARTVEPQVFDVLSHLVAHRSRLVTKEELLDAVWGDRFVSDSALTTRIKQARRVLDDDGARQWAIRTLHGRGYRLIAPVEEAPAADPGPDAGTGPPPVLPARGLPAPATDDGLPVELRAGAGGTFYGRAEELRQCLAVLDRPAGTYGWIWILGEPGIGKSRLATEVARDAHRRGHRVLFGRNAEDLRVPYQPFIEAARMLPSGAPNALVPQRGTDPSTGSDPAAGPDDETRRYELFESVARWLGGSGDAPVTVVIDDVHWAAEATLQLLAHLRRRPDGGSLTLVLTARDTAPDVQPRTADLVAAAPGGPSGTVARLAGLAADEAAGLIGDPEADMTALMRQTAGNPLLLQAAGPRGGPGGIDAAVRRRLAGLEQRVQQTLRLVAVLGLEFELRVAAAALGRDELDLLDDLEAATAARLLHEVGTDRFRFTHALIRSSLRDQTSATRRARQHARIAQAVQDVFGDDPEHLPALAHHTAAAAAVLPALRAEAIDRLRRAARLAAAGFSFEEASDLLGRARSLATGEDADLRARLALEQGQAQARDGSHRTAVRTFTEAITLAGAGHDTALQVEAALRLEDAAWRPGLSGEFALGHLDRAEATMAAAIDRGEQLPDVDGLRVRLVVARLRSLALSGRRKEVEVTFEQARALATGASPDTEALVLNVYLSHVVLHEDPVAGAPFAERLTELTPRIEDGEIALHTLHDLILYAIITGRFAERERLVRMMAERQRRTRSQFWRFIRANQETMEAFYRGDLPAAERTAAHCRQLSERLPGEDGSGTFGLRMFLIRREQDRLAAMAPLVRRILDENAGAPLWTPGLALLLAETGRPDQAAEVLATARESGFEFPRDALWSTIQVFLAETMVALGDAPSCAALHRHLRILAGTNVVTGSGLVCFGRAERYLGMLSLVLGDLERAEHELSVALEGDRAGGSPLWTNESRLWLSRVRRAQGHTVEADLMARAVAEQATAAGLPRLARVAAAEPTG